jgi:hypothetical protein
VTIYDAKLYDTHETQRRISGRRQQSRRQPTLHSDLSSRQFIRSEGVESFRGSFGYMICTVCQICFFLWKLLGLLHMMDSGAPAMDK